MHGVIHARPRLHSLLYQSLQSLLACWVDFEFALGVQILNSSRVVCSIADHVAEIILLCHLILFQY